MLDDGSPTSANDGSPTSTNLGNDHRFINKKYSSIDIRRLGKPKAKL